MSERLVLDENIIYKAILKNEDKHEECKKLVETIDKRKHTLVCSQNLLKRYEKIIKNLRNRKTADEIALSLIWMKFFMGGEESVIIRNINEKEHQELFKQMKGNFEDYYKQKAERNEEDLEIAKLASVCAVYALITEDFDLYTWMNGFVFRECDLYEKLRLQKPKILNSSEALKDKKINLESSYLHNSA